MVVDPILEAAGYEDVVYRTVPSDIQTIGPLPQEILVVHHDRLRHAFRVDYRQVIIVCAQGVADHFRALVD